MKRGIFFLTLCLAVLAFLPAHGVVLELRDHETVSGPNLCLDDLLQSSQGLSASDLSTVLAIAPSLGGSETWTRDQIENVLPVSLKGQGVEWSGATACVVNRPAEQYGEPEVRQIITAEIARHLPDQSHFQIIEIPGLQPFLVPSGTPDVEADLSEGTLRNEWGQATLQFRSEGQVVVVKNVRFHWAYTRQVWRATGRVAAGDDLAPSGFEPVNIDVLQLPGVLQPVTDFPQGKVAAHLLSEGKILMENDWVEPTLVNRNDLVTVAYDHNGLSITVAARALASGIRDQVIQVQNLSSRKIFNARVVDERTLVYDN
jgi:flagella basal body P-ring formation protein FlgA